MPVYAYLQSVRYRGNQQAWPGARAVACNQTHSTVSSVGRERLRSCAMKGIIDIHHHGVTQPDTITSVRLGEALPPGYDPLSVGVHPWDTCDGAEPDFDLLEYIASQPRVYAVGEAGIDRRRGGNLERQERIFIRQAEIAERLLKPMIIHCVRANDVILRLKKQLNPRQEWIIHGFRGNGAAAQQLTRAGISLSFGACFNPEAVAATPADRLYTETDESSEDITEIRRRVLACRLHR